MHACKVVRDREFADQCEESRNDTLIQRVLSPLSEAAVQERRRAFVQCARLLVANGTVSQGDVEDSGYRQLGLEGEGAEEDGRAGAGAGSSPPASSGGPL